MDTAAIASSWRLNLNYVGSQVGHKLGRVGAGDEIAIVQNFEARQRCIRGLCRICGHLYLL